MSSDNATSNHPKRPHEEDCDTGRPRRIRIVIDQVKYRVPDGPMTGTELRQLAKPQIGPDRDLWRDIVDTLDDVVDNDEIVHLENGMRFFTVPREINPGQAGVVAAPTTSPIDVSSLAAMGFTSSVSEHGALIHVVISDFPVPPGLSLERCELLLRLPRAFPDATPDMFWVSPSIVTDAGSTIDGTQSIETYDGRVWQRWSRHIGALWRPGIDDLGSYIGFIRSCLNAEARRSS